MADPLGVLWACFDSIDPLFAPTEIASWDRAARDWLIEHGVLKRAASARMVACPSCPDGHVEAVLAVPGTDPPRFFIPCPEAMRVEIDASMLEQWSIDGDAVAALVAAAIGLCGTPKPVVPDRLWRLGRTPWRGSTRQVVLARRLCDDDAERIACHVGKAGRDIILVGHAIPDDPIWPGRTPAVIALSQVATVVGAAMAIDAVAMAEMVDTADQVSAERAGASLDAVSTKNVQRHVRSAVKSLLTNDALVEAYRVHLSYRKAADGLNEQGFKTNRWAVERAVKAAGGPEAVTAIETSASVDRTVASHPRDMQKKFAERR